MERVTIINQKFDSNGNEIYHESVKTTDSNTILTWWKAEYDSNGNQTIFENERGWWKAEYDSNGNQTYFEDFNGWWVRKYDANGNVIEQRLSNGDSWVREFNDKGELIYYGSNIYGDFSFDNRPLKPKQKKNFFSKLFA